MRFANYCFNHNSQSYIGDWMQIVAIDELYRQMGVDLSEVVYIDVTELPFYKGEYVILPVSMPLVNYVEGGISRMFSEYIIPVFLGLTMVKDTLEEIEINYLKKYEPIGCRDEKTLNVIRKYGIKSFLNGCMTITLPEYNRNSNSNLKPYIVDVTPLYDLIPDDVKERAVYRTHFIKNRGEDRKALTKKIYQEYKEYAGVVITSLLHCALPCLAAGIPVILIKREKDISYRFSWIEKILPIYTETDLRKGIDWNPASIDISDIKKRVFDVDTEMLRKAFSYWSRMSDISWFYENRDKHIYINDACEEVRHWIDNHWIDKTAEYRYAFWGLTQMSEWIDDYIRSHYPNAVLSHVYDAYRELNFRGLQSIAPQNITDNIDECVFVTALGAVERAKCFFMEIGKQEDTYVLYKTVTYQNHEPKEICNDEKN